LKAAPGDNQEARKTARRLGQFLGGEGALVGATEDHQSPSRKAPEEEEKKERRGSVLSLAGFN